MFKLSILLPSKEVFKGQAHSLTIPGSVGYLEVLSNHASLMTALKPGEMVVVKENREKLTYAISGGLLEVYHNEVVVLADALELPAQIDLKKAEEALKRADEHLNHPQDGTDIPRAKQAKLRAENRIHIFHKYQKHLAYDLNNHK